MAKRENAEVAAVGHNSYAVTRFNALQHGILSRYTVLPWEEAGEYEALLSALVEEHKPRGPTEEHLVEELVGVVWRKQRLRLAEASAMRRGLHDATESWRKAGKAALVCVNGGDGDVAETLSAMPEETQEELQDVASARRCAERALAILQARKADALDLALEALHPGTREEWLETVKEWAEELAQGYEPDEDETVYDATPESLAQWLETLQLPWFGKRQAELANRDAIRDHALGEAMTEKAFEMIARYETHLDRKLERTLAMLLKLKDLRRVADPT